MYKIKVAIIIVALFAVSFTTSGVRAEILPADAVRDFTLANAEYAEALKLVAANNSSDAQVRFKAAGELYGGLVRSGYINGQVCYNLGNTYYRLGELGKAILFYNKAQKFMPRNSALKENMRLVRSELADKELQGIVPGVVKALFFWYFLFNLDEATIFALSFYIVFAVSVLIFVFTRKRWLKPFYTGLGIAALVTGVSFGVKIYTEHVDLKGVVVVRESKVRYGPGEEYEVKFLVHEGTMFRINDQKDDWYKVDVFIDVRPSEDDNTERDGNGYSRVGWLPKDTAGVI